MNLSKAVKITQVIGPTLTGTTDVNGATVDMQGYEGVLFVGSNVTPAANNSMKAQQGAASDGSDAADLAGSAVAGTATKKQFVLDVYRPTERYVRPVLVRTTGTVVDSVWAIQYGAHVAPISNVTTAIAAETHVSPAEGTA